MRLKFWKKKEMSLEEFKDIVGRFYWHYSLEEVKKEYRRIIADAINKMKERDREAAEWLAERSNRFLNEIIKVDKKYVPVVFEAVGKVTDSDVWTAYWLADYSAKLLEVVRIEEYKTIVEGVEKVARKDGDAAKWLIWESKKILKVAGIEEYCTVAEGVEKVAGVDEGIANGFRIAMRLVRSSADIFGILGVDNCECYQTVVDSILKVAKNDTRPAYWLADHYSAEIVKTVGIEGYRGVVRAVNKIAKKNGVVSIEFVMRADEVSKKLKGRNEVTYDHFLIELIKDQKDAQLIGHLISKENLDLYNEKIQEFY